MTLKLSKFWGFKLEKINRYTKSSLKGSLGCTAWTSASDLAAALLPTTRHNCSDNAQRLGMSQLSHFSVIRSAWSF